MKKMNTIFRPAAAALLASSLLLGGCSGLIRSEFAAPEVQVPEHWQSPTAAVADSLDPWWQSFGDVQLNRLVEQVLQQNNDLALATLTLQKARLQAGLSEQDLYPKLASSISTSRSRPMAGGGYQSELFGQPVDQL